MTGPRLQRAGLGLLVILALAACEDAPARRAARPPQRSAVDTAPRSCPTVSSAELSSDRLVDSKLVSLAPRIHGRQLHYRVDGGKVEVYMGIDIATKAEDLDFLGEPEVINGRDVTYFRSAAVPRINLVLWRDTRYPAPCDQVGVFTEGLDEATVRRVVGGITVVAPVAAPERAARKTAN